MGKLQLGINDYISNAEYHADREYLSSSAYKLLLKSAKEFAQKYIEPQEAEEEQAENPAFSEGSLVHALILEPDLVDKEFAFFSGFRKQGTEYRQFKLDNPDKTIISASQKARCEKCVENFRQNPAAVELLKAGIPEHTVTGIFQGIKSKVRTDWINVEEGYIADVKTTAWGSDLETFSETVKKYQYDLSAVLYKEIVKQEYGKNFDFYFIVISKKEPTCDVFKLSDRSANKGFDNLTKAARKYRKCLETGIWVDETDLRKEKLDGEYEILEV